MSAGAWVALRGVANAQQPPARPAETAFRNVRVLDVVNGRLGSPTDVLIRGNRIAEIAANVAAAPGATVVEGRERTLMPGLIDAHVHMIYANLLLTELYDPKLTDEQIAAGSSKFARTTLRQGFTAVRDVGGPVFPLKKAIDAGKVEGPRVWPSGATISQTSGHGDLRTDNELSRRFFGKASRAETYAATFIADGKDEVRTATRENLRRGASQIKLMAGGGTSSVYDPLDVTQYSLEEMQAAVEAAEDWNTYVTVHAYTPRAVKRAIEAGVKCVEHGQLLDEETIALMAQKGVWLSGQNLVASTPNMTPERKEKRIPVIRGNERVWPLAKKHGAKMAWGTDLLFEPDLLPEQNRLILLMRQWFTPAEVVKMITYDNAQLLAMSGPRTPYEGKLGVVETGALADLLLVEGDPLSNLDLLADPAKNFAVVMKDGKIYKGAK